MNELHNEGRSVSAEAGPPDGFAPGHALARLFELTILLSDAMGQGLVERGLTRARATVIWQLHHQGPCTQRELSQALGTTPRNVTGLLDALESDGFVTRQRHPRDRRATVVGLTARGREAGAMLNAEQQECATMLFGHLAPGELDAFVTSLDRVLDRLRTADFASIRLAAMQRIDGRAEHGGAVDALVT